MPAAQIENWCFHGWKWLRKLGRRNWNILEGIGRSHWELDLKLSIKLRVRGKGLRVWRIVMLSLVSSLFVEFFLLQCSCLFHFLALFIITSKQPTPYWVHALQFVSKVSWIFGFNGQMMQNGNSLCKTNFFFGRSLYINDKSDHISLCTSRRIWTHAKENNKNTVGFIFLNKR